MGKKLTHEEFMKKLKLGNPWVLTQLENKTWEYHV
jgi:hypothetical protein